LSLNRTPTEIFPNLENHSDQLIVNSQLMRRKYPALDQIQNEASFVLGRRQVALGKIALSTQPVRRTRLYKNIRGTMT